MSEIYSHELVAKVTAQERAWQSNFSKAMRELGLDPREFGKEVGGYDLAVSVLEAYSYKESKLEGFVRKSVGHLMELSDLSDSLGSHELGENFTSKIVPRNSYYRNIDRYGYGVNRTRFSVLSKDRLINRIASVSFYKDHALFAEEIFSIINYVFNESISVSSSGGVYFPILLQDKLDYVSGVDIDGDSRYLIYVRDLEAGKLLQILPFDEFGSHINTLSRDGLNLFNLFFGE